MVLWLEVPRALSLGILIVPGFPGGSVIKNSPANAEDMGSIPGAGRSPGEGNGNSSILAWGIPWTEELSRPMDKQK